MEVASDMCKLCDAALLVGISSLAAAPMSTSKPKAKAIQAALLAVKQRVHMLAESWSTVANDKDAVETWARGLASAIISASFPHVTNSFSTSHNCRNDSRA